MSTRGVFAGTSMILAEVASVMGGGDRRAGAMKQQGCKIGFAI